MKMQNTDMEFVTFDAQDVIATSGPVSGDKMQATLQDILIYNESAQTKLTGTKGGSLENWAETGAGKEKLSWYLLYGSGSEDKNSDLYSADEAAVKSERSGIQTLTATEIGGWLAKWANNGQ